MNASQTKTLIEVARKAREALLALDPDSVVALELWTAIHRATQEPAKPATRTKKIPKAQYGPHVWRDGKCLDADDARAFANMVHAISMPAEPHRRLTAQRLATIRARRNAKHSANALAIAPVNIW